MFREERDDTESGGGNSTAKASEKRIPSIEPLQGEAPETYIQRLCETVYTSDLQRAFLQAYSTSLVISMVGSAFVKSGANDVSESVSTLFQPESLRDAAKRYLGQFILVRGYQGQDLHTHVQLQPQITSQVIDRFGKLADLLKALSTEEEGEDRSPGLVAFVTEEQFPGVYRTPALTDKEWASLYVPFLRQELTWMVRYLGEEGLIELGDFEVMAVTMATLFAHYDIADEVHDHCTRLIFEHYQLDSLDAASVWQVPDDE